MSKEDHSKKEVKCLLMMNEDKKCQEGYTKTKSDIKKLMLESRELATQLVSFQSSLFEANKSLQKDQGYLQKMSVKEM